MARKRHAQRLHALLSRLRSGGVLGILRGVLELPSAFSCPIAKLAGVLRLPPALLWAAITALLGSAVLALSWILTVLILAVTRPLNIPLEDQEQRRSKCSEPCERVDGDAKTGAELAGLSLSGADPIRKRSGSPACNGSDAGGGGKTSSPVTSWPLGDGADTDDEYGDESAGGADGIAGADLDSLVERGKGHSNWQAGGRPFSSSPGREGMKDRETRAASVDSDRADAEHASRTSAWRTKLPAALPYMDEQRAAEVRRHVSRYASVIPATAFEAARCCDAVFGLGLDAGGYSRLQALETAATAVVMKQGREIGDGEMEEEMVLEDELPQEGAAALGRLALHTHLARYLYGLHGGTAYTPANTPAADPGAAGACSISAADEGSHRAQQRRPAADPTAAPGAATAAAAAASTLYDIAVFVRTEVLAGLARRLRLDLLMYDARRPGFIAAGDDTSHTRRGESSGSPSVSKSRRRRREVTATARVGPASAAAPGAPLSPVALAAALLRLVWEAHVAEPERAWLAVCVLAGLAQELRLVV
ncbi:hypothetical protein VOLCADRAFT_106691 [Volvox carteri f. nagariensis]|uniref:Uncharacterized protein n=1 Tax=Volvox carteri f. nagariensis TaxID=3068 RepID=D8U943_VOLCA|nr:uncharacterized protein VOLCADRAFT_106691 [Volvox carteri f. nagariensis]EFJ43745.1 hypothetical protein VOLCADRAFT_106691 [Volvox carteri f. nagariensis]|eukprot:XP_002955226.1 hypothetical protein VOLCADRAFT_106691 [Volvox carteri f. nagariensis]